LNRCGKLLVPLVVMLGFAIGCGNDVSSTGVKSSICAGTGITGILHDSLTNLPVKQGVAALESAGTTSVPGVVPFSAAQTATTDATGAFQVCLPNATQPTVALFFALDAADNSYPPLIQQVTASGNLGTLLMGGCRETCGLPNQRQAAAPATADGEITSTSVPAKGSVAPQLAISALDGSSAIWNLSFPPWIAGQSSTFTTAANACSSQSLPCASYEFLLPSENPVVSTKTGFQQKSGVPVYSVSAQAGTCSPASLTVDLQTDGKSLLTAAPGARLTAQNIGFTACH
jgi:hypothetical protein